MGIHDEHRKRLKARFMRSGLRDFDEHTALELLLTYSIPRRDVNAVAHRLIDGFGGFGRVLEADPKSLVEIEGVGENSAALIKLVFQSFVYYEQSKYRRGFVASSTGAAIDYARSLFVGETDEVVYALCLDSSLRLICARELSRGAVSEAAVSLRRIVEAATLNKAVCVILAHNHPGGYCVPSRDDLELTRVAMQALSLIGVSLSDHIIVGARSEISMADAGIISGIREKLGIE
ncbi:MAG: JAB domain-containing protein [Oscillospiraceae bacterium]